MLSVTEPRSWRVRVGVRVVWGGDGRSGAEWANNVPMTFPCTCIWCYATRCLLAWAHAFDATLLDVYFACAHVLDATLLDVYLHMQCTHTWCYTTGCLLACEHILDATLLNVYLHVHMHLMLCHSMFICMCTCIWCYATQCLLACAHAFDATPLECLLACAHAFDATLLDFCWYVFMHLMLRHSMFTCMCTRTWCYTTGCLLECAHVPEATLLHVYLHVHMHLMLHHSVFTGMSTCIWCYATGCLLACAHALDAMPLDIDILACAHVLDATLLDVYLHVRTYLKLRYCMFTCMCTCIWCYGTARLLACAHVLATPLHVYSHVHKCLMLKA